MNRRRFILFATAATATLGSAVVSSALMKRAVAAGHPTLYSASDNPEGGHFLTRLDLGNGERHSLPVPVRGHAVMPLHDQQVLMFGRRPAFECVVADFQAQTINAINVAEKRHFNGHGCISATSNVLLTTENDYEGVRGVLGVRDSQTFQVLDEYETHGLDPHDVHLMPDGRTLVVANGGIQTHPDFGRRKLNIDTMQPSLVYLDVESRRKLDEYRLPDHHLSIRHLIVTDKGDVGVALQYEGNLYRRQPESLVAWQPAGGELRLLAIEPQALRAFSGYMADLAFDPSNGVLAVTSPRGNHVSFWDVNNAEFTHAVALPEPSGIAFLPEQGAFLVSDATGGVHTFDSTSKQAAASPLHHFPGTIWDNHLVVT